jgi:hypothetical protein
MKKATAFLTLVGLLGLLAGGIYLVQYHPDPQVFKPALEIFQTQIDAKFHSPILIGFAVLYLAAFLTSLMALFATKPAVADSKKEEEKTKVPDTRTEDPDKTPVKVQAISPEEAETHKNQINALEQIIADQQAQLKEKEDNLSRLDAEISNLNSQLEKFSVNEEEKQQSREIENRLAEAQKELKTLKQDKEKVAAQLEQEQENVRKGALELEAMAGKINSLKDNLKALEKEKEKLGGKLKDTNEDFKKKKEEIAAARKEIASLKEELQAAIADKKSGKHGIPPAAYQILYLFQKEGRLIDLLMEDVTDFDDETLGGAIRPIHEGCRKLLKERLVIEPVLAEEEGSEISLDEVDPESIKLSGNVPAQGPYTGELVHRGWRLKECHLPELVDGWAGNVVAPAEIEIS